MTNTVASMEGARSSAGTAQEEARRAQLREIAEGYFRALASRDVSTVPWHEEVVLRSPLAPEGLGTPLVGRDAVVDWFTSLYPVLGPTTVVEHYFNEDLSVIATRADVGITDPECALRVVDRFRVDAEGRIVEQENHYDPRPAIPAV